ncbi:MAG: DUF58 domain-containing protein [bacterium]|nr:DUF58 domain-containing protein [bacterium]
MPAARVFFLLALTTILVVAAVVEPRLGPLVLALDGAILLAFVIDYLRLRGTSLAAFRTWPEILVQGVEAEVNLELTSTNPRPLVVRLREALHPALSASPQSTELKLPGRSRTLWTYSIEPRRRGEHRTGPLTARVLGPWRLAWTQQHLLTPEALRVYPRVRWDGKVGRLLLLAHRHSLGRNPRRLQGLGTELYALREYRPGDPPNKVHWKATARHGRLVSREETWERGGRLIILLDCARSMSGRDGERSKLDHALAASLALTRVAASRGDQVTLTAFSDRIERSVRIHSGHRSIHAAYGNLYDLDARIAEPAFDLAAETATQLEARRSTVVLFTSVVDLAAAELLRRAVLHLERRHRPILINLQDPELVALALGEPDSAEDAFAKVSALDILLANRRLGARLRHAGIRVVNTSADRLALETLEAYLAMFGGRGF